MRVVPYAAEWHERVLAFRQRVYPTNRWGGTDAHLRWRFLDSPLSRDPVYLLAVEGDTILGQWAGIHDRIWSRGEPWDCAWMVDLVVAPEHRDTMAAAALFRQAMRLDRPLLAIGAPDFMMGFYRAFRWARLAVCDTFYSVFRPGPLLRMAGQEAARSALRIADLAAPWLHRLDTRGGSAVEPIARFGAEVDDLWDRVRDTLGTASERSSATLDWKFTRRPCGRHVTLGLRDGAGLRGLAVVKLRERAGVSRWADVADVLVHPDDGEAFGLLAGACRRFALDAGVDFVRLRCSLPQHTTLLQAPRWVRRVRAPVDDLFVFARGAARDALTAAPWYYTAFCSDAVDTGLDEWEAP